jgi:hypothetical protein
MFNLRLCGLAAGIAFVLSLLAGLFGGVAVSVLLLRAGAFAGVFFLLAGGVHWIARRFLPGLVETPPEAVLGGGVGINPVAVPAEAAGSRVNILEGEDSSKKEADSADPVDFAESTESRSLADLPDLVDEPLEEDSEEEHLSHIDMDHLEEGEYTKGEDLEEKAGEELLPRAAGGRQMGEFLPDLDSMAKAFASRPEPKAEETGGSGALRRGGSGGGKSRNPGGKYDPQELAQAIRTKIKTDEG